MNIYEVYITSVYTVLDIRYSNISDINYKAKYTRDAIVLKKKKFDSTYYIDLFTKTKLKTDIHECNIGDELVVPTRKYEPVVDYLNNSDIEKPNMSKRKLFKMLLEKSKKGEK